MVLKNNNNNNKMSFKYIFISFIKILQKKGLKELVELNLKQGFSIIKKNTKEHPIFLFIKALERSKPFCVIKLIRISGNVYKIPVEISKNKQQTIVLKWIVINILESTKFTLKKNIAKEIIDSCFHTSKSIKMCDDFHKIAESNKINILTKF